DKRLAVHVEDHPVEYADYEGVIPDDNYGAGPVIVWDRGTWRALEDPFEGMKKGKLLFEVRGQKLRGVWTLVRTKTKGRGDAVSRDWLLIKHRDEFASKNTHYDDASVLSGLTLAELQSGAARAKAALALAASSGAPRKTVSLTDLDPMLAEPRDHAFTRAGWIWELKYDGFRLFAAKDSNKSLLRYRRGLDSTASYPELARAIAALPFEHAILDGEVAVLDENGRPRFERLLQRAQLQRAPDIARAALQLPAVYFAFDLIAIEGFDLRALPLIERKRILKSLLPGGGPLRFADHIDERGEAMLEAVRELGLEGVVGKRADSTYRAGRSADWVKVRFAKTGDFLVVGYAPSKRGASAASLHLAAWNGDQLNYVCAVGSGLTAPELDAAVKQIESRRRADPPFVGAGPEGRGHVYCDPFLICEVRYKEWTEDRGLRQPSFIRFRTDKTPTDCERIPSSPASASSFSSSPDPSPPSVDPAPRTINFTNLTKTFWPEENYTKGDLIDYYASIAPWLLTYLRDRPLVLTRFPDGIHGKSFFQKDAPGFAPDWVRTERMWSEQAQREIDYFICDDAETLVYLVNLGTIPLHVWASRIKTLERPDWTILDLDPKGAPFSHVIEVALAIRALCEEIALPCYCKTSGSTGLHVLVPLGRACTFEQARTLADLLARVIVARKPELATLARVIDKREGKVYLDWLQNGHGRLLAAPFSARPVPGALVSTPLDWKEVTASLDPTRFTIKTVPARMRRKKRDPLAAVVEQTPDLTAALERLAPLLE
ncbi:MAG TPA: DNA ligase D, partial [Casimicrobiaceae bacterium]|nr:DNA ligase D [Casimicrobiaceae bacterium]